MNTYKGFTVADVSTRTDDGRYRARAAIMSLNGERTRSQRFLDLEIFRTMEEAHQRTMAVAMVWIDKSLADDCLALPTRFYLSADAS